MKPAAGTAPGDAAGAVAHGASGLGSAAVEIGGVAGGTGRAAGVAGSLLIVVEAPEAEDQSSFGVALGAEGFRLARELGVEPHFIGWPAGPDTDLERLAGALADMALRKRSTAVLLADTDTGRQLAPMVAHRLNSGAVVGCTDILVRDDPRRGTCGAEGPEGQGADDRAARGADDQAARGADDQAARGARGRTLVFVKPVYGGWLEQEIVPAPGVVPVAALDLDGVEAPAPPPEALPGREVLQPGTPAQPLVRRLELVPPDAGSVDLAHARRIVAAGAGSTGEDLLTAVRELAGLLEGSVGGTRPMIDDGNLPKERLIGQTGRTVAPELYLALGISGSPHHLAGVRRAARVLSINRDVRAPIFRFSDVGYVAELGVVLPALVKRIKEWRDALESTQRRDSPDNKEQRDAPGSLSELG